MADLILKTGQSVDEDIKFRYKDMGDGTYALVTYNGVQAGETIVMLQSRVDVGIASTAVLAPNASRKYVIFINDSDAVIYLSFGGAAQLYAGVRVNADGGNYEMGLDFGNNFTGAVYAIHGDAGTKRLLVNEGV